MFSVNYLRNKLMGVTHIHLLCYTASAYTQLHRRYQKLFSLHIDASFVFTTSEIASQFLTDDDGFVSNFHE